MSYLLLVVNSSLTTQASSVGCTWQAFFAPSFQHGIRHFCSLTHNSPELMLRLLYWPTCSIPTLPCFQHSLKSFQLLLFLWSLSHRTCLSQIHEYWISLYRLLQSSWIHFLSSFGSSFISDFTFIFGALFGGILFSTTEAIMSSRMFGIVLPLLPLC